MLMSVSEACAALRIGKTTLYVLLKNRRLTAIKIGRGTRITAASVREFIGEAPGVSTASVS